MERVTRCFDCAYESLGMEGTYCALDPGFGRTAGWDQPDWCPLQEETTVEVAIIIEEDDPPVYGNLGWYRF